MPASVNATFALQQLLAIFLSDWTVAYALWWLLAVIVSWLRVAMAVSRVLAVFLLCPLQLCGCCLPLLSLSPKFQVHHKSCQTYNSKN